MSDFEELSEKVIIGDFKGSAELTVKLLKEGKSAMSILNEGLLKGMSVVGEKFKCDEYFIPDVLLSAKAMEDAMTFLKPELLKQIKPGHEQDRIVIGTVLGDNHNIGKNLVKTMLERAGYEIIDLGINISPESFVKAALNYQPRIVALSALLTTTMVNMKNTIDSLRNNPSTKNIKVIVGGVPVTQEYADRIGADGYSEDAVDAIDLVKNLLKK